MRVVFLAPANTSMPLPALARVTVMKPLASVGPAGWTGTASAGVRQPVGRPAAAALPAAGRNARASGGRLTEKVGPPGSSARSSAPACPSSVGVPAGATGVAVLL